MKKLKAYRLGHMAEAACIIYLTLKGYKVLERRFKTRLGEVDIVAKRGKNLAFVEVKARNTPVDEVLNAKQRQRITEAASLFLAKRQKFANSDVRFDLIMFKPPCFIKHVKDAWRV